jgi:hypothetical protein
MVAFEQERTQSGLTTRYRGVGGSHDDRVMSLVIGASVALTSQVIDFVEIAKTEPVDIKQKYSGEWLKIHKEISDDGELDPFDYN